MRRHVIGLAALAAVVTLAGCQDIKPLQKDIADLKGQVSQLQSQMQASRTATEEATAAAQSASQSAKSAENMASQALAASQTNNEKIDRAIRQAVAK